MPVGAVGDLLQPARKKAPPPAQAGSGSPAERPETTVEGVKRRVPGRKLLLDLDKPNNVALGVTPETSKSVFGNGYTERVAARASMPRAFTSQLVAAFSYPQ